MRFLVCLFFHGFCLFGQSPFFTQDAYAYMGMQFPAGLGLQQQAYIFVGSEYSRWQETHTQIQTINFATPTPGDRWTWAIQVRVEQGFAHQFQQLAVGWAFRLPLDQQRHIFLGTRLKGRSLQYHFKELQHIQRPDPLLFDETRFGLDYTTSLAFQSKQGYCIQAWRNLPLIAPSRFLFLPTQKQFFALVGYPSQRKGLGQWHGILGVKKNKAQTEYFGVLSHSFPWQSELMIYGNNRWNWSIRWQQPIAPQWTVGFAYGQAKAPWPNQRYGFSLAYHWELFFDPDKPVESLDYQFEN